MINGPELLCIVRNLYILKFLNLYPTLSCLKNIGRPWNMKHRTETNIIKGANMRIKINAIILEIISIEIIYMWFHFLNSFHKDMNVLIM